MENTFGMTAKEYTTGSNFARRNSAGRLILRIGLGGLALLLWQTAPVKAQECCPDSNTAAELARFESASKKPVKMQTAKMQQGNSVAGVKMVATGSNRKMYAKPASVKESALGVENAAPGKPVKVEAVSDRDVQKKADGGQG
ncbi:MAG: hypothetical protein WAM58_20330 [Candidatus Acidiferrum sp.]